MTNSVEESKRPVFGARFLNDPNDVFKHNVWDDVQWDEEQEKAALKKVEEQAGEKIPELLREKLKQETQTRWDEFYDNHQTRFFKDRHWLFTEFPELGGENLKADTPLRVFTPQEALDNTNHVLRKSEQTCDVSDDSSAQISQSGVQEQLPQINTDNRDNNCTFITTSKNVVDCKYQSTVQSMNIGTKEDSALANNENSNDCVKKAFFEIGCGVGNTVFPILEYNIDPNLFVYCCDFSKTAVDIVKSSGEYDPKRCEAFVCDVTADDWETPFAAASLDIITLIFVLSAIHPQRMEHVVKKLYYYLKPGGQVLFRDYGRYDMAQLRFKNGQMMEDNFYVRKDGTFVYFFTQEEVRKMFCQCGFVEEQNHIDRRLQVNRSRQLKMYRVWIQAKFRKPLS